MEGVVRVGMALMIPLRQGDFDGLVGVETVCTILCGKNGVVVGLERCEYILTISDDAPYEFEMLEADRFCELGRYFVAGAG
jgi:hypothetical protein